MTSADGQECIPPADMCLNDECFTSKDPENICHDNGDGTYYCLCHEPIFTAPENKQYCFLDDKLPPRVAITSSDLVGMNETSAKSIEVTFVFSETVMLQASDINATVYSYPVQPGASKRLTVSNFTVVDAEERTVYSANITGWSDIALIPKDPSRAETASDSLTRLAIISLNTQTVRDRVGNSLVEPKPIEVVVYAVRPTVQISSSASNGGLVNRPDVPLTFLWSEPVRDFASDDVEVSVFERPSAKVLSSIMPDNSLGTALTQEVEPYLSLLSPKDFASVLLSTPKTNAGSSGNYTFSPWNDFTVSAWVRLNSAQINRTNVHTIASLTTGASIDSPASSYRPLLQFSISSSGRLMFSMLGGQAVSLGGFSDDFDTWHLYSATYNYSNSEGDMQLFRDGRPIPSHVRSVSIKQSFRLSAATLVLGARMTRSRGGLEPLQGVDNFLGDIGQVQAFSRALSEKEIRDHYDFLSWKPEPVHLGDVNRIPWEITTNRSSTRPPGVDPADILAYTSCRGSGNIVYSRTADTSQAFPLPPRVPSAGTPSPMMLFDGAACARPRQQLSRDHFLDLDGVASYGQSTSKVDFASGFTMAAWVRRSKLENSIPQDMSIASAGGGLASRGLDFAITRLNRLKLSFYADDLVTDESFPDDVEEWHWYVATYDPSDNFTQKLYRDGSLVASRRAQAPLEVDSQIVVGARYDGHALLAGHVADFSLYQRVLDKEEIRQLYISDLGIDSTSPVPEFANRILYFGCREGEQMPLQLLGGAKCSSGNGVTSSFVIFDGDNDYVESTPVDLSGASLTLSMWVRRQSDGNLVWWGVQPSFAYRSMSLAFVDHKLRWTFFAPSGEELVSSISYITDLDQWHMYSATYDHSTGQQTLFRDGLPVASRLEATGGLNGVLSKLQIGGRPGLQSIEGAIEGVQVFTRLLTQQELAELYSAHSLADYSRREFHLSCTLGVAPGVMLQNGAACARDTGTVGLHGSYLSFDGINDYVRSKDSIDLSSKSFSLTAWVKRLPSPDVVSGSPRGHMMLVSSGRAEANRGLHWAIVDDHLRFGFFNGREELISTTSLWSDVGHWHLYSATYDAGANRLSLYRDAVLVGSRTISTVLSSNAFVFIGAKVGTPKNEFFAGSIDDFRLYLRVLSPEEITRQYTQYTITENAGRILHFPCERGDRSSLVHQSVLYNGARCVSEPFCQMQKRDIKFSCQSDADCGASEAEGACVSDVGPVTGSYAIDLVETLAGQRFISSFQTRNEQHLKLFVPSGRVFSRANNKNLESSAFSTTVVLSSPTVIVTSSTPQPTNSLLVPLTFSFSQAILPMTGIDAIHVETLAGSPVRLSNLDTSNPSQWTLDASLESVADPADVIQVYVEAGAGVNAAGTPTLAIQETFRRTVDARAPTVNITSPTLDPHNGANVTFIFEFSEAVVGFEPSVIDTGKWPVTHFEALLDPDLPLYEVHRYVAFVQGVDSAKVSVSLLPGAIFDEAGNALEIEEGEVVSRTLDLVRPSVQVSIKEDPLNAARITVSFEFSEPVVPKRGLEKLIVYGSRSPPAPAISNFRPVSQGWSVDIIGRSKETLTFYLDEGAAEDAAGWSNMASPTTRYVITNTDSPRVIITSPEPAITRSLTIPCTMQFSKNVLDFESTEIDVSFEPLPGAVAKNKRCEKFVGGSNYQCKSNFDCLQLDAGMCIPDIGDIVVSNLVKLSNRVFATDVQLKLRGISDAIVSIMLPANATTDFEGEYNLASNTVVVRADQSRPEVDIVYGTFRPVSDDDSLFIAPHVLTFSEPVEVSEGLSAIYVVGTSNGQNYDPIITNFTVVDDRTWSLDVIVINGAELTMTVAEGAAKDLAGWPNLESIQINRTVDTLRPRILITSSIPDPTNTRQIPVIFKLSKPVDGGLQRGDIEARILGTNNQTGIQVPILGFQALDEYETQYEAQVLISGWVGEATLRISIAENSLFDDSGNGNFEAVLQRKIDYLAPHCVISSSVSNPTNSETIPLTFTWNEQVVVTRGEAQVTVTVKNSAPERVVPLQNLVIGPTRWEADVSGVNNDTFVVVVYEDAAVDLAGNPSLPSSNPFEITIDTVRPILAMSSSVVEATNNPVFPVTFSFSQPVLDFTVEDILITEITNASSSSDKRLSGRLVNFQTSPGENATFRIDSITGGPSEYIARINIVATKSDIEFRVLVREGSAYDAAGNYNTRDSIEFEYHGKPPMVTVTSVSSPTSSLLIPFTFVWDEIIDSQDFSPSDVDAVDSSGAPAVLNNETGFLGVVEGPYAGRKFTLTFEAPENGESLTVIVKKGAVADSFGNMNDRSNPVIVVYNADLNGTCFVEGCDNGDCEGYTCKCYIGFQHDLDWNRSENCSVASGVHTTVVLLVASAFALLGFYAMYFLVTMPRSNYRNKSLQQTQMSLLVLWGLIRVLSYVLRLMNWFTLWSIVDGVLLAAPGIALFIAIAITLELYLRVNFRGGRPVARGAAWQFVVL